MALDIEYDDETELYHASSDWSKNRPSTAAVEMLAFVTGRDETEISPLYDSIDPDSLDRLFEDYTDPEPTDELEVAFTHEGVTVTVKRDGTILGQPVDEER